MKRAEQAGDPALPFFMPARPGQRFCLFYPPAPTTPPRGAILYVHPFAEELNKSRRMAALQARAFAAAGYGVLQIDLYGCGDSSGDFADARWPIWQDDLALAGAWLARRCAGPISIWGLRLGALLALDAAAAVSSPLGRIILWHPFLKGKTCIDQFLRVGLASQMLSGRQAGQSDRQSLADGVAVEVGGYLLAPQLADAIDRLDADALTPVRPVHWFELAAPGGDAVAPAAARLAARWHAAGVTLALHTVPGEPFWAAAENHECQALLAATTAQCT